MLTLNAVHESDVGKQDLASQLLETIRQDSALPGLSALHYGSLLEWCGKAVEGLNVWVAGEEMQRVMDIYYQLGRSGHNRGIPVPELLRAISILSDASGTDSHRDGAHAHFLEERSQNPLTSFRDYARYYVVRGYQDADR